MLNLKILLLSFAILFGNKSTFAQNRFGEEIQAFQKMDSLNPPPRGVILFTGSSSIRLWTDLTSRFPDLHIINRGFGGSEVSDVIQYAPTIIYPYQPSKTFIYVGTNDIGNGKKPETVINDIKNLVDGIQKKLPATKIYYISIQAAPIRQHLIEEIKKTNNEVKKFMAKRKNCEYIDLFEILLGPDGKPQAKYFGEDQLHMNKTGYDMWAEKIRPYLYR